MKADDWNQRYEEPEQLVDPNRFLVSETEAMPPGRALDLACGAGRHAVWLAEHGWRVRAVDFSDVAVGKGRMLAESRRVEVDWAVADLTAYEPEPSSADLVILFYLQLPPGERRGVVRRAAQAVAPGGTFLVVAHDTRNLEHGYGGPKSAEVLYTSDDVVADLEGSGLEVERAEPVERPVETPEGEHTAIDALVRARRPVG